MAIATQCVQEELELVRNMSLEDILSLDSSFTNENFSLLENGSGILNIEDSAGNDIKKLTISIIWSYGGTQMRKEEIRAKKMSDKLNKRGKQND